MNMQVGSYETKYLANMKAVRTRLMNPKVRKPKQQPVVEIIPPEWMRKYTTFDAHVVSYHNWEKIMSAYTTPVYVYPISAAWARKLQTFSQHIVDYYDFKKAVYDRQKQLDDVLPVYMRKPLPDILQEVKTLLGCKIPDDEIRGDSRTHVCVEPRHYTYWAIRKLRPDMSYPQIGRFFGKRDHTTVLHGERKIENLIKSGKSKLFYDGNQIRKVETQTRTPTARRS